MNTTSYQDFHITDGVLSGYTGREECITVPEDVHTIGEGAFKACVSLKKVILPEHLCHILSGAFKGCRKLEDIHIPDSVSTIGDYAFHRCHALRSIALPPSIKELGDCVFLYCDHLTCAKLPGVVRMGKQVFVNDVLLEQLTISPDLEESCICDVFTGCSRLAEISFFQGESFTFPNAVEAIAGGMQLPSLVRAIAADVLRMMELDGRCLVKFLTNLKHVEIPEGIEKIGKSCFFDKRGILSVTFPASLNEIESRAFRNCISLESVRFQNHQVLIHKDAFKNCSLLKEIRTSDKSVYRIHGIRGLTVSDTAKEEKPLSAQSLVRTIHGQVLGNFCISGTILLKYLGEESRVLVPDGITCIAEEAFAGKESIDRVILPGSLEEIGDEAFRDCLLLQTISLPENLSRIGEGAFEHCVKLLSVHLPEKLKGLEAKVFKNCHKLKEVVFGTNLRAIGEQAFYGCGELKKIVFPQSLTSIGEMAFYRCAKLQEVCLFPGLERVGSLAFAQSGVCRAKLGGSGKGYGSALFSGCISLHTIFLEHGVRHIPDKLACKCRALKNVIFPEPLPQEESIPIASVGRNVWDYTPFLEQWLEENPADFSPLQNQAEENVLIPGVGEDGIFWDGGNLSGEVHLSEKVRIIAGGAFYGNEKLTAVYIPETVTWVGPAAFKGCSFLRRVIWPEKLTTAEAEVFSGCTNLEYISSLHLAPVSWMHIKERAFFCCFRLRQIAWDEVRTVGKEAFYACHALLAARPFFSQTVKKLVWVGEGAFSPADDREDPFADLSGKSFLQPLQPSSGIIGSIFVSGKGCSGLVQLPEGITAIAPYAFWGNREITRLILPKSLKIIGEGAFWGCSGLVHVENVDSLSPEVPPVLSMVGSRAFEKCTSLSEIRLFARRVNARAFACCTALKKAELFGVHLLENRLFEHCTSLEECSCKMLERDSKKEFSRQDMDFSIDIGEYCFSGCQKLKAFDFSLVEKIGSYAFLNCDGLKAISLKDHTFLSPHAFEDCGSLEEIWLTGKQGTILPGAYAFSGCTAIKRVIQKGKVWTFQCYHDILSESVPEMIRRIFYSAFSCFTIEQEEILCAYRGSGRILHIPCGIRKIEAEVFRDVLMLRQIEIPETVEEIGARAFHGTAWMEEMRRHSPLVMVNHMLLDGSLCVGEVDIPKAVRQVCGWAFAGGMGITKLRFLSDGVRVDAYAFRNCIHLKEMEFADGRKFCFHGIDDRKRILPPLAMQAVMDSLNCFKTDKENRLIECTGNISCLLLPHGITAIGDCVFQEGNLLTEITVSSTVTSIGKFAFAGCKWLKKVKQAQSVTAIGERAFSGCGVLETIELSGKLTCIGIRAFENCTSLKEILLPEGLEEIPDRAFFRCHSLHKITLPSSLKHIGKEAFAFCKNLEMPVLPKDIRVEEGAFTGIRKAEKGENLCTTASLETPD